jgi:hypothetical protein
MTVVVSVEEKARRDRVRWGTGKASVSEPLMTLADRLVVAAKGL